MENQGIIDREITTKLSRKEQLEKELSDIQQKLTELSKFQNQKAGEYNRLLVEIETCKDIKKKLEVENK